MAKLTSWKQIVIDKLAAQQLAEELLLSNASKASYKDMTAIVENGYSAEGGSFPVVTVTRIVDPLPEETGLLPGSDVVVFMYRDGSLEEMLSSETVSFEE